MASSSLDVDEMVRTAMKTFREHADESFDDMGITDIMRKRISKEKHHTVELNKLGKEPTHTDVREAFDTFLTADEIQGILKGFDFETFTMKVDESQAKILRKEEEFMDTMPLGTIEEIRDAIWIQIASLVIELILFMLSVLGIKVEINDYQMRRLVAKIVPIVRSPGYRRIIDAFLENWRGGSAWQKAKAIFIFLKDTSSFGILWKIIKLIFANMSTIDKTIAFAEITAMLIAALATEGLALIAKIALTIESAVKIGLKIKNLITLIAMSADNDG